MKKIILTLYLLSCFFVLVSCSSSKDVLHLGVNAVITEVDASDQTILVRDSDKGGPLGEACRIDCSEIPMIYCNYDAFDDVRDISFADLQVNDEVILSIYESELEAFQDKGATELKIDQLQLGTQRIK